MKILKSNRVVGRGLASKNGYPTVNVQFELDTIEEGLWMCYMSDGTGWDRYDYKSIASVSKYKGALCTEIHCLAKLQSPVKVGDEVTIYFIKKLRDKISNMDPIKQIQQDIDLAHSITLKSCEGCERYYSQDEGYSNYTVENTIYGCFAGVFDEDEVSSTKYCAEECPFYKKGDMWVFDVDGEESKPSKEWHTQLNRDIKLIKLLQ